MSTTGFPVTGGTGTASVATEVVGGNSFQQIEVYGAGGGSVLGINPDGSIKASIIGIPTVTFSGSPSISGAVTLVGNTIPPGSVSGTVGASVIGTVPVTQGGNIVISGSVLTLYAPTASLVSGVTSVITGTSSVQVLAPAAGGQRNYITNLLVTNGAAVGTFVNLYDAGQVIYSGYAAASGGGFALAFPVPLKQSSISGNLSAGAITQASIVVAANGFTAA
jgi:hypothetical protein